MKLKVLILNGIIFTVSACNFIGNTNIIYGADANLSKIVQLSTTINTVSPIEIKKGVLKGESSEYYLAFPKTWQEYIKADREISPPSPVVEQINLYFKPKNKIYEPAFLINIFVVPIDKWSTKYPYDVILQTDKYVFVVGNTGINPYKSNIEKKAFDSFLNDINTNNFLGKLINAPSDQKISNKNAVYINNKRIDQSTYVNSNNNTLIPLRATCENLGYNVKWDSNKKIIIISDDKNKFTLDEKANIYKFVNVKGTVYIPATFFVYKVKVSVDIDDDNNAYINSK